MNQAVGGFYGVVGEDSDSLPNLALKVGFRFAARRSLDAPTS
jgi:hypothetical protein